MEISSTRWISEWEMEDADPFMNEFEINPFDFLFDELKFEQNSPVPPSMAVGERPAMQLKVAEGGGNQCSQIFGLNNNNKAVSASTSSHLISFENSNSKKWSNNEFNMKRGSGSGNINPMHARDHVIAERKRREKLSQRFIALSALIPDLNKVDKASILGGAVRHVKELQERLKVVEDQEQSVAVVHVKRTSRGRLPVSSSDDDDNMSSSSEENSFFGCSGGAVPEIEARMSNKDVLVRVHCHKRRKGCLSYLLAKIESLNLTILNSTALPFAHSKLDITIVAQVDEGFCMTVEDVVKNLRQALLDFN